MEKVVFYKNKSFQAIILLIGFMLNYLLQMNFFVDEMVLGFWGVFLVGSLIKVKDEKDNNKQKYLLLLLWLVMGLNYILFRYDLKYIPNYILVFNGISLVFIYTFNKEESKYKFHKIALIVVLLIGFFSIDYYQNSNSIIKDRNFRRFIKKEYGIKGRIEKEDLSGIERLGIDRRPHINSIEGIEYFKDVKRLYISDGETIRDFKPIAKLHNLKALTVWYVNVDKLEEIQKIESLEYLEILYPKAGKIDSLENFPNLKKFEVQGMDFDDLTGLKGPEDLETLSIAVAKIDTFEGIEQFPHLKELDFYVPNIRDCSRIFDLKELENIRLKGGQIDNADYFNKMTKVRGINVERKK